MTGGVRYHEADHGCPICGETEYLVIVGFPAAKCVDCGYNRAGPDGIR